MIIFFKSVARNIKKYILYSLCVGVGISAVLTVSSLGGYCIKTAQNSLDSMGISGYAVSCPNISDEDYLKLLMNKNIKYASPVYSADIKLNESNVKLLGTDISVENMYSVNTVYGDFFTSDNVLGCDCVCVISSNLSDSLFKTENGAGKTVNITIGGIAQQFTVTGVYKSDPLINGCAPEMFDERIYIPYTVMRPLCKSSATALVILPCENENSFAMLSITAESIFGQNYTVKNIASDRAKIENMMQTVKNILSAIGSLTLIVSAISITVILIINVRYAREEIGLKKAIGATDFNILCEVIIESVAISVIGYILGLLIFLSIKFASGMFDIVLKTDYTVALIAFVTVIVSSAAAGVIPGIIAAKTDPAITLKN
jgi:putative ABC transport system permease protein